ncbi:hypothetical protein, partial [Tautonia rosea]|uniref:hypothetical protein n=1 Tax=Tautonia rosea TaxID=2728037 RepID=UPI0019D30082
MRRLLLLSALAIVGCSPERNDSRFISGQRVQVMPSDGQRTVQLTASDGISPIESQDPRSSILTWYEDVSVLRDDEPGGAERLVEVEIPHSNDGPRKDAERVRGFIPRRDS